MIETNIQMFSDNYAWNNKLNTLNRMVLNSDGNLFAVGSISAGNAVKAGSGHYLQAAGSFGLLMNESSIQMFSDNYSFINKLNSAVLMTLDSAGNLVTAGKVTASGGLIANGIDALYLRNNNYTRMHWQDQSQPTGAQTFTAINYLQKLQIVPTSDNDCTCNTISLAYCIFCKSW
jgi:hypothetical protein